MVRRPTARTEAASTASLIRFRHDRISSAHPAQERSLRHVYLLSVPLAYVSIYASFFIFALIPAMYFLLEKKLGGTSN